MYKTSYYNFICDKNTAGMIIFNSKTGAILYFPPDERELALATLNDPNNHIQEQFFDIMVHNGIIVDSDISEFDQVLSIYNSKKSAENELHITILPTLSCNFNCKYCFEDKKEALFMNQNTYDAIYMFIFRTMKKNDTLFLNWFGGEPLLSINSILKFMERVSELVKEKQININCGIITNGYLLNYNNFVKLYNSGVSFYQITFDGSKYLHNKYRKTKNGLDTFDTIFNNLLNIKHSSYSDIKITIRCNMFRDELNSAKEFIETYFSEFYNDERFNFVLKPILEYENYNERRIGFINYEGVFKQQYAIMSNSMVEKKFLLQLLQPRGCWCNVDKDRSFIIDPNGNVYACDSMLSYSKGSIGVIKNNGTISFNRNKGFWKNSIINDMEGKCKPCKLFPLCLGGCRRFRKISKMFSCYLTEADIYLILEKLI